MIPTPDLFPDLAGPDGPHWQGARQGKVMVQRCTHCAAARFPSLALCPECGDAGHAWEQIRPTGRILSWCRLHRGYFPGLKEQLPYTVLLVQMDDGVKLFSNPVDDAPDTQPRIGAAVTAVFEPVSEELTLIRFAPTATEPS